MKILKISASNSKRFRVYGIFRKLQIDDDGQGDHQIQQFLRQLLIKTTSGLKNSLGYLFWLKKLKNDIKIALKPNGIKLQKNLIKIYYAVYICEKENDVALQLSKPFFNPTI